MTSSSPKADRFVNRAPKGGAVSLINGRFYAGGQFMPMVHQAVVVKTAALEGSSRQVAWAARLRREHLDRLAVDIATRRLFLNDAKVVDEKGVRRAIRRDEAARYALMTERSAARLIDRRSLLMA